MTIQEYFDTGLFSIGPFDITVGHLFVALFIIGLILLMQWLILRRWLPPFLAKNEAEPGDRRQLRASARWSLFFLLLLLLAWSTGVNPTLHVREHLTLQVTHLLGILLAWQAARFFDRILSLLIAQNIKRQNLEVRETITRTPLPGQSHPQHYRAIQYIVYLVALFALVHFFGLDSGFDLPIGKQSIRVSISNIIVAVLIILVTRVLIWMLTQFVLYPYFRRREINIGSQYAINQLIRYSLYVIALMLALQSLGLQMTLVWGGAAALLVGVGLGLQQTFNDFFSGLVLLFERSVEVGDVVDVGGLIGTVRRIGPRASHIQTRENITVIVPNSKLVNDNVINWSHHDNRARFFVAVGVAYGSDTELVKKALIEVAQRHEKILNFPRPFVRFIGFGDSSLDFQLLFWTTEMIRIEDIKSDLRFAIDQAFRENKISIPFPQRDVWFRNPPAREPDRESGV